MVLGSEERALSRSIFPDTFATGDYTLGSEYTATADGIVTHLCYYHAIHAGAHTHLLSLWDKATGTKIASVTDTLAGGEAAGFREVALTAPAEVVAGATYIVSYAGGGQNFGWSNFAPPASLALHLTASATGACWYGSGLDVFPNSPQTNIHRYADVVYREGFEEATLWPVALTAGVGPEGPPGPTGPPGPEGGGGAFHHTQSTPSTSWTVTHNLGRHPVVSVLDSADSQVEVSVAHVSLNQLVLTLAYAVSGTADCS